MKKAVIPGFEAKYLFERGNGNYLYRRRIPAQYQKLAGGLSEFKASLKCKTHNQVIEKYGQLHAHYERLMGRLKVGKSINSTEIESLENLKSISANLSIQYRSKEQLIQENDLATFTQRLIIANKQQSPDPTSIQALFGMAANEPCLDDVLDFYNENTRDTLIGKNPREISQKTNPVKLSVKRISQHRVFETCARS